MRRARSPVLALLLLLAGIPSATAQTNVCRLLPGAEQLNRIVDVDGRTTTFVSGPARFRCSDGTVLEADSAVHTEGAGALELIGRVLYRDSVKTLRAEWVNYLDDTDQLYARDDVVLTDLETGSVVRGPRLEHREGGRRAAGPTVMTPLRPRDAELRDGAEPDAPGPDSVDAGGVGEDGEPSFTVVYGGRAHATMRSQSDASDDVPDDSASAPLEVEADRIEIEGQAAFDAYGGVEITKDAMRGFGEEASYRRADGELLLTREARVEDDSFQLFGDSIEGALVDDELREVAADGDAVLLADELRIDAARLLILLEQGELQRLVARGPPAPLALAADSAEGRADAGDGAGADARAAQAGNDAAAAGNDEVAVDGDDESAADSGDQLDIGGNLLDRVAVTGGEDDTRISGDTTGAADGADDDARGAAADEEGRAGETIARAAAEAAPDDEAGRPRIEAEEIQLTADSIDVRAPAQQLERVIAVGRAYGERLADSLRIGLPEGIDRDWVRGDTIIGYFTADDAGPESARDPAAQESDAAGETAAAPPGPDEDPPRRVLERLVSIGADGDARSIYRSWEQSGDDDRPSINYVIAKRITLSFEDGEVADLEAEGPVRGINLQPGGSPPGESTADAASSTADSGGS